MTASRLLAIQMLLETRGRMSAQTLATMLEVSVRTLYRDVDRLAAAGVPIYADRGRSGGFQLMANWKTTLTGLTSGEAQAVLMSGLGGPATQLGIGADARSAQRKLLTALPSSQRETAQRAASLFHLDTQAWYKEIEPTPHLRSISEAVWDGRQIAMRYASWKAEVQRTVHPLGLVLKAGAWYLVAAVQTIARTYRVANILLVTRLEAAVTRPNGFDLAAYWAASVRRFEQSLHTDHASALATPDGIEALALVSSAVAAAVRATDPTPWADGRIAVRFPIESIRHSARELLALAPEVEVIEPVALRAEIIRLLDDKRARYS